MLTRLTHIDYETLDDGEFVVRIAGRSEDNKRVVKRVTGCEPYLFVPEDEMVHSPNVVRRETGFTSYDGVPLQKLVVDHPKHTEELREQHSLAYESDIPFYRRMALDGLTGHVDLPRYQRQIRLQDITTGIEPDEPIQPRVCIADIEVLPDYSTGIEVMKERAHQPVISISLWDSYSDDYHVLGLVDEDAFEMSRFMEVMESSWGEFEEPETYTEGDITLHFCDDEGALLRKFISLINEYRPDIIGGWNYTHFDHIYLLRRMERLETVHSSSISDVGYILPWQLNTERYTERLVPGLPSFDMMNAYTEDMSFHKWRSKALDYVSTVELGVGKVTGIEVKHTYENDPTTLLAYNCVDTQLCVALERKLGIFEFFFQLADLSSVPIFDVNYPIRRVDGYILSRRDDHEILPDATEEELERNAGGLVFEPPYGMMDWVGVFDVKSLYPSGIITMNISPETLVDPAEADLICPAMPEPEDIEGSMSEEDIKWEGDGVFGTTLEKEGIVPKYLKRIFPERDEMKARRNGYEPSDPLYQVYDQKQTALKVLMNTFYGLLAMKYWRLSAPGLGDFVTGFGRYVVWYGGAVVQQHGYDPIYADTDSEFVQLGDEDSTLEEVVETGQRLLGEINDSMTDLADTVGMPTGGHPYLTDLHGTDRHCLVWEFEKVYQRYLQAGKKKRYAGRLAWKEGKEVDEVSITGFESKRADIPEAGAATQEDVMQSILYGDGFDEVSKLVRGRISVLKTDFSMKAHGLSKKYDPPYKVNLPVVRAVNYSNEHLGRNFEAGERPWIVYVDRTPPGYPTTDVIALEWTDEVPEGFRVDTDKMVEKCFEQPLRVILSVVGWEWTDIINGTRVEEERPENPDGNPFA